MNKIFLISFLLTIIIACAEKDQTKDAANAPVDGSLIYKKYCNLCHGVDGKLGINGSKDITASILTKEERIILITHGKNTMTPFGGILSKEEIEAVAEYTFTLKSSE